MKMTLRLVCTECDLIDAEDAYELPAEPVSAVALADWVDARIHESAARIGWLYQPGPEPVGGDVLFDHRLLCDGCRAEVGA
jgi:hypothetical protein